MANDWVQMSDKCRRRTVAVGQQIHHVIFEFEAGGVGAPHAHPHEQTTYLVSGRVRYEVAGVARELGPGDVILVPGNALHGMVAIEPSVLFDTFVPPREDMLAVDRAPR